MRILMLIVLAAALLYAAVALMPCLGELYWIALPVGLVVLGIGVLGLLVGRGGSEQPARAQPRDPRPFIGALLVGGVLTAVAVYRCFAGEGG